MRQILGDGRKQKNETNFQGWGQYIIIGKVVYITNNVTKLSWLNQQNWHHKISNFMRKQAAIVGAAIAYFLYI